MSSRLTARDIQKPLHQIDFDEVPLWPDHLVNEAFLRIRDEQWLDSPEQSNFKRGRMTYKDHVAVIVRDSLGCIVMDPPLNFERPLRLEEWIEVIHQEGESTESNFSICNALTVGSNSYFDEVNPLCETGMRGGEMKSMDFFAAEFLSKEWNRVLEFGLLPKETLASLPPWLIK